MSRKECAVSAKNAFPGFVHVKWIKSVVVFCFLFFVFFYCEKGGPPDKVEITSYLQFLRGFWGWGKCILRA